MRDSSAARWYDLPADDHHLIHAEWDANVRRQGQALDALIGQERAVVLDCSCGIGTRAVGLALRGHRVTGTDLSPRAAARAAREAARRGVEPRTAAADMRRFPFADAQFDAVARAAPTAPRGPRRRSALQPRPHPFRIPRGHAAFARGLVPGGRRTHATR
ncbi:class I SAM-dependent methyltransferase [Streptomyces sp. NPDC093105]|uniref:class I SAM-dependent methyltransferase n=1 Tax=Streptomyces sp. NPDC093105 TaxID=3366029 RepID=UPI00380E8F7C